MPEIRVEGRLPSHAMAGFPQIAARPDMTIAEFNALDQFSGGTSIRQALDNLHTAANLSPGTGRGRYTRGGADPFTAFGGVAGLGQGVDLARAVATGISMTINPQPNSLGYWMRDMDQHGAAVSRSIAGAQAGTAPGGTGIGVPTPPGGWATTSRPAWGLPPFLQRAIAASGGGGFGGGGGGGGGAGGAGAGGFGGANVPFAGMLGLGATSKILTGGFTAGLAIAAMEELAFAPQHLLNLEGSALSASKGYRGLQYGTYALGRAGGFSGQKLLEGIYQGVEPPKWMSKLGLGPEEALSMLSGFGIVQRPGLGGGAITGGTGLDFTVSPGTGLENELLIRNLAKLQFNPAFSGLDQGAVQGSVAQAARYGMVSPDAAGVQQFGQQIGPIMTMAVEQGLDRAAVLRSIDAAVGIAARGGGIGANAGELGRFVSGFGMLPGGRTGEFGLSVLQNLNAANASVGSDTLRTTAYMMAVPRLSTEAQMKAFLEQGGKVGAYDRLKNDPVAGKQLQYYFELVRSGNPLAAQYLRDIVGGGNFPEAEASLLTGSYNLPLSQLPENLRPLAAGLTGLPTSTQFIANQIRTRQTLGDRNNNPLNLTSGPGGSFGVYPDLASGIAANVGQLRRDVNVHGLKTLSALIGDPTWGWAPAKGGNNPVGYAARVAGRLGIGVNDPINADDPAFMARLVQAMAPEEVGHDLPGGAVARGVETAMGQSTGMWRGVDTRELGAMRNRAGAASGNNMPTGLDAQAAALAGIMRSSEISFGEVNGIITTTNQKLHDLGVESDAAAKAVNRFMRSLTGAGAGPSTFDIPP